MVLPDVGNWKLPPDETSLGAFSLKYPFSCGWKSIGIGAIIAVFAAILIFPIIVLWGFRYRMARAGARGDESAPEFNDFGSIIKNGVLLVIAFLPYVLIVCVLTIVISGLGSTVNETFAGSILFLWSFAAIYAGIAIHPTFVATGSIGKTYSGLLFVRVAATREYLVGFLFGIVLRLLVGIAMFLLFIISIITLVGPFVVVAVWYAYDEFIAGTIWGHVARSLAEKEALPTVTPDDSLDI
jgi:hypothetical protein